MIKIYNNKYMTKTFQQLTEASKKLYCSPYEVTNFISTEELSTCISIYNKLPVFKPASHNRATRKDFLMHNKTDTRMKDIFLPKLQSLFPDKEIVVDGGNFTTWHAPVTIHTDGYQFEYKGASTVTNNQEVLGYAVLVPLSTDTNNGVPATAFFNQTRFGGSLSKINDLRSGKGIDNFTSCDFNTNDPNYQYISHNPIEKLFGFTLKQVIPWKLGSAVIWHRAQFHCATNFVDFNSKLHLIFFTNFK